MSKPCLARRAFSLIELLVTVSLTAVVLATAVATLQVVHQVDRQYHRDAAGSNALTRLAARLRADAHAARNAERRTSREGVETLVLPVSDGTIVEYRGGRDRVTRWLRDGQRIVHREVFRLPSVTSITWSRLTEPIPMLRLEIRWPAGRAAERVKLDVIEAALGTDYL